MALLILFLACPPLLFPSAVRSKVKINDAVLEVEWARSDAQRTRGLQGQLALSENEGMIFDYGEERFLSFWMKNTDIPLSIAFIGADGVIQEIGDMNPGSLQSHRSRQKARYALEVNQGWFERHQIKIGDRVEF